VREEAWEARGEVVRVTPGAGLQAPCALVGMEANAKRQAKVRQE
jgi:hypothetical protein